MKPRNTAAAGLVSAVIVLGALMLLMGSTGSAQIGHTCSATDKAFITEAQVDMATLSAESEDYLHGGTKAAEVIDADQNALDGIKRTGPSDPSLAKTRLLLTAMFAEYGNAIRANQHHKDPGQYIYRAYGLANFAHDILSQARLPLKQHGCDVSSLL